MLILSIFALSFAVLLGIKLLSYLLKNNNTPKAFVLVHGLLAFVGIALLTIYNYYQNNKLLIPLMMFIVAAIGGIFLSKRDFTAKPIPKWVALVHASAAVLGLILLFSLI